MIDIDYSYWLDTNNLFGHYHDRNLKKINNLDWAVAWRNNFHAIIILQAQSLKYFGHKRAPTLSPPHRHIACAPSQATDWIWHTRTLPYMLPAQWKPRRQIWSIDVSVWFHLIAIIFCVKYVLYCI